jgi:hypothetical protein
MTSCYNVSQLRPLALCIQGLPLGYRSVSLLAKGEAEGLIYETRLNLKVGLKLPLLRVMVANHHGEKDTRSGYARLTETAYCLNSARINHSTGRAAGK